MKEDKTIAMMQQIEDYVLRRLSPSKIDRLWVEFLKAPVWYEIFEIELMLRMIRRGKNQSRNWRTFEQG